MNKAEKLESPKALERGQTYHVPLQWIIADESVSPRRELNQGHIRALREGRRAGREWEPLTVAQIDNELILVDGFHRYHAMIDADTSAEGPGRISDDVKVKLSPTAETLADARWEAARLNWETRLGLNKLEREEGVRRYFEARQHRLGDKRRGNPKPIREIARELSIPRTSLQRLLERLDRGKYLKMLGGVVEERSGEPPADQWKNQRAAEGKKHAAALAAIAAKDPKLVLELVEQVYLAAQGAVQGKPPATLAKHVEALPEEEEYDFS